MKISGSVNKVSMLIVLSQPEEWTVEYAGIVDKGEYQINGLNASEKVVIAIDNSDGSSMARGKIMPIDEPI